MGLTRLAIQRPLAILMLILGLVLMGGVAYTKLRQDRFPAISFPFVSVSIQYPGAAPGGWVPEVLHQVRQKLEPLFFLLATLLVPERRAVAAAAQEARHVAVAARLGHAIEII